MVYYSFYHIVLGGGAQSISNRKSQQFLWAPSSKLFPSWFLMFCYLFHLLQTSLQFKSCMQTRKEIESGQMGVSMNGGTLNWMVYNGKSDENGWFGGTLILGNHQIVVYLRGRYRRNVLNIHLETEWEIPWCRIRKTALCVAGGFLGLIAWVHGGYMGVSINGDPQNGWFKREHPIKMDDFGVPLFRETTICL